MPSASSLGRSIVVISMNGCLDPSIIFTSSREWSPHLSAVFSNPIFTSKSLGVRTIALNVFMPRRFAAMILWWPSTSR